MNRLFLVMSPHRRGTPWRKKTQPKTRPRPQVPSQQSKLKEIKSVCARCGFPLAGIRCEECGFTLTAND